LRTAAEKEAHVGTSVLARAAAFLALPPKRDTHAYTYLLRGV